MKIWTERSPKFTFAFLQFLKLFKKVIRKKLQPTPTPPENIGPVTPPPKILIFPTASRSPVWQFSKITQTPLTLLSANYVHDSQWRFEFSRPDSLFFIILLIILFTARYRGKNQWSYLSMDMWHLNNTKFILTLQALSYVDWFFIMFTMNRAN